ncbi:MAG: SDR family oxidoreductase [Rhodospirillaceae bacterium]|mgnify:FL=1|jgi:3-oxoacyl-[acyl-carrier protein] reductase|nr:SDR family oxidoreductase [Rhodospirillales bacterium]MBT3906433.1 SDR family oxidoreductase [Rhodospirillaceae bacterium]MBT4703634.1 SDR family oxidoreductase [Rhodospirillaceae bacterium]MBT5034597.1 SDR family oxidoreductase [Rhodospirillaceae bacterium]MBT6221172.1 SDR family oxidoreductase [Rhodospirillaceae bacterium]
MDLQLARKRCLVTGASRGLGRSTAVMLAAEGCAVAVVARRAELLEELSSEIVDAGGAAPVIIVADVTDDGAVDDIINAANEGLGGIDILINSAGGSRPTSWDAAESEWEEGMGLNFTALRRLSTAAIPGMQENNWGRVINITGTVEPSGMNIANAAKSAVHAWAKGLSRDIAKDGVTVNSIAPGRLKTEQIMERRHPDPAEREEFAERNIPVGYFGEAEDLAVLAVFLASPLARYITGELFHVDGGMKRFAH